MMESEPAIGESSGIAAIKVTHPPRRCLSSFFPTILIALRCCLIEICCVCLFGLGAWISLGHGRCGWGESDSSGTHSGGSTDLALAPPSIFIHRPSPPPTIRPLILIWLPGMGASCASICKHYHSTLSESFFCTCVGWERTLFALALIAVAVQIVQVRRRM